MNGDCSVIYKSTLVSVKNKINIYLQHWSVNIQVKHNRANKFLNFLTTLQVNLKFSQITINKAV